MTNLLICYFAILLDLACVRSVTIPAILLWHVQGKPALWNSVLEAEDHADDVEHFQDLPDTSPEDLETLTSSPQHRLHVHHKAQQVTGIASRCKTVCTFTNMGFS